MEEDGSEARDIQVGLRRRPLCPPGGHIVRIQCHVHAGRLTRLRIRPKAAGSKKRLHAFLCQQADVANAPRPQRAHQAGHQLPADALTPVRRQDGHLCERRNQRLVTICSSIAHQLPIPATSSIENVSGPQKQQAQGSVHAARAPGWTRQQPGGQRRRRGAVSRAALSAARGGAGNERSCDGGGVRVCVRYGLAVQVGVCAQGEV